MDYRKRCYESYVSKFWSNLYSLSPQQFEHMRKIYKKRFKGLLPQNKDASILDAACGTGYFLYYLQKEGYEKAAGVDLSAEQLEIASQMGIKNVYNADIFEFLNEGKNKYDLIVANDLIEHLTKEEVLQFLDLIHSALKPDGKVLLSTGNTQSLFGAAGYFADFTHQTGFTSNSLAQVMSICNFTDVKVFGEKPIIYDVKSAIRASLWYCLQKSLKIYAAIERGTGRGIWQAHDIFEPRIYVVAIKPTQN